MVNKRKQERRRHRRYVLSNRIIAMIRSDSHQLDGIERMSKGEIAMAVIKSRPSRMGEIVEISRGGLSFSCVENDADISQSKEMDILFTDDDFYLSRLPFKTIKEKFIKAEAPFDVLNMTQLAVQFESLTENQRKKLDQLLDKYTSRRKWKSITQTSVG